MEVKALYWRSPQKATRKWKWQGRSNSWLHANTPADPWLNHYLLLGDKSPWMHEHYKGSCIGQPWNRISCKISRAYPSVQLNVTFLLLSPVPSILSSPKETAVISTLSKTDRLSADKTQFTVFLPLVSPAHLTHHITTYILKNFIKVFFLFLRNTHHFVHFRSYIIPCVISKPARWRSRFSVMPEI